MTQRTIVAVGLLALLLAAPVAGQVTTVDELSFPELRRFDPPEPRKIVLDNGLTLMLLEDHELPLVDGFARIRTGGRLEPPELVGLASLTGTVLRTGGTSSMTGDEIDEFLENRAASIETSIRTESGSAAFGALVEDFPAVFELFADILRNPVFEEDEIAVAKNRMKAEIARQNDDPTGIMFRELTDVLYGEDSPYARNPSYATVARIERQDLVDWHRTYFHPNNVILGVVGDIDPDAVLALVEETLGDWEPGPEPIVDPTVDRTPPTGVFYVPKSDMTQSNIAMGHMGIRRDDPDYYAVEVLNEVLGGGFASRLFSNVRSKKGLAYAVSGGVGSAWDHRGTFRMWMTTKVETTGAGIEALLEEARGLTASPPTPEEVDKAKRGILNSFVFTSDSTREILSRQLAYEYYGYPLDWLSRYQSGIEAVTVDEVRAAAEEHVHPDRLAILVVGPEEGRDRPLSDFGQVSEVDISIPPPPGPATVEGTEEDRARAAELLDAAVEAAGGAERLAAVESLRQRGSATLVTPQGSMQAGLESVFAYPDKMRQELKLPIGSLVTVATPDEAFMVSPRGFQPLEGERRADADRSIRRNLLFLLRSHATEGLDAVATGTDASGGGEAVQVTTGGDVVTLVVEPETGHVLRMIYQDTDMSGAPGKVVQTFSELREVEGILLPFVAEATFEGEPLMTITLDEIEIDAPVEAEEFAAPTPTEEAAGDAGG